MGLKAFVATALVATASVCFGMVPYFAKNLIQDGMAAPAVAFYRYVLTAIVLLPFLSIAPDKRPNTLWGIFSGMAMGLGWIGYVEALKTIPISIVGVLYMTYPMFTVIFGWIWFGYRPNPKSIFGALLILVAAILAMSPSSATFNNPWLLLAALAAPVSFGLAVNVLTNKLNDISPLSRMASVSFGSVVGLLPLMLTLSPEAAVPTSLADWWLVAGIAIVTAILPQFLYVTNAPQIGSAKAAMAGSVELPAMFVVGWLAFGEHIGPSQWMAGAMVLAAIFITPAQRATNLAANLAAKDGS